MYDMSTTDSVLNSSKSISFNNKQSWKRPDMSCTFLVFDPDKSIYSKELQELNIWDISNNWLKSTSYVYKYINEEHPSNI